MKCPICNSNNLHIIHRKGRYTYNKCGECNHVHINPMLDEQTLVKYNTEGPEIHKGLDKYFIYREKMSVDADGNVSIDEAVLKSYDNRINIAHSFLDVDTDEINLFDIGFGTGVFLHLASRRNWGAYGVDTDKEALEFVSRYVPKSNLKLGYYPDDNIRFNKKFDICMLSHTLEHVIDLKVFQDELDSSMNVGGILCIVIPNINCRAAREDLSSWHLCGIPLHVQHFSLNSLELFLSERNWKLMHVEKGTHELDQEIEIYFKKL